MFRTPQTGVAQARGLSQETITASGRLSMAGLGAAWPERTQGE